MAYKRGAKEDIANRGLLPVRYEEPDINSGKLWSEADIADLHAAYLSDADIGEISEHLCRDWKEVAKKCAELNLDLRFQSRKRAGKAQVSKQDRER